MESQSAAEGRWVRSTPASARQASSDHRAWEPPLALAIRRAAIFSAASRVPATTVRVWVPTLTVQVRGNISFSSSALLGAAAGGRLRSWADHAPQTPTAHRGQTLNLHPEHLWTVGRSYCVGGCKVTVRGRTPQPHACQLRFVRRSAQGLPSKRTAIQRHATGRVRSLGDHLRGCSARSTAA